MTEPDLRRAYVDAVKRMVTGYSALGGDREFEAYNALSHYDIKAGGWTVPRQCLPLTLLAKGQLDLIEELLIELGHRGVAGDCIEAGIWRGGAVIAMRAVLDAWGMADRQVIAADSFAGIPASTQFLHDPVDLWPDRWIASLDEVTANIARAGMLDGRIELLAGLFADSLPGLAERQFAFIRLDSDSHDSVMDSLTWLYPLLAPGGVVVIDDWHLFGCKLAVDRYRERHGITDPIHVTHGNGYWFKGQDFSGTDRQTGAEPG